MTQTAATLPTQRWGPWPPGLPTASPWLAGSSGHLEAGQGLRVPLSHLELRVPICRTDVGFPSHSKKLPPASLELRSGHCALVCHVLGHYLACYECC